MQELEKISKKKDVKLKLISISKNNLTLQKAELSKNYNKYKYKFLNSKTKIKKSDEILNLLNLEFDHAIKVGFSKYDVWTNILKKDFILKFLIINYKDEIERYNSYLAKLVLGRINPETVKSKVR